MRGDPARPYWGGFSEGQWTAAALILVVVGLERLGILPFSPEHLAALEIVVLTMAMVGGSRRFFQMTAYRLLNPRHVREIALSVQSLSNWDGVGNRENRHSGNTPVHNTSLGIQISASRHLQRTQHMQHYAISCRDGGMTDQIAKIVARLIFTIAPSFTSRELVQGRNGVYHLILCRDHKNLHSL
jgi:hypothetical protein